MPGFTVTPEEMRTAAAKFSQESENITQTLRSVKSQIENLRSTWTGTASNSFNELMAQWGNDADGIRNVLDQVIDHLKKSADEYDRVQGEIDSSFRMS